MAWHVAVYRQVRNLQGFLTDYFTAVPETIPDPDAPAILLVHGFGAFGEQWRGQIEALAAEGHLVSTQLVHVIA